MWISLMRRRVAAPIERVKLIQRRLCPRPVASRAACIGQAPVIPAGGI